MLSNNFVFYITKILLEIVRDILYFPVWWYSRGLVNLAKSLLNFIVNKQKSLVLFVWIKNVFTPMYGQSDWQGKIISFLVRLIQIFVRSLIMFLWLVFALIIFCFWIILPVLVVYEIIFQLFL